MHAVLLWIELFLVTDTGSFFITDMNSYTVAPQLNISYER